MGLRDLDVIVPAYTCRTVPAAILASGNRPTFVDIGDDDYNMDVGRLGRVVGAKTGAVLATHMYGVRTDVETIRAAISDPRIFVVEDSAQASPQSAHIRGDVAVFITGRGKPMCTVCGGMAVTNSEELRDRIKAVRDNEMTDHWARRRMQRLAWFLGSYLIYRKYPYYVLSRCRSWNHGDQARQSGKRVHGNRLPADVSTAMAGFQARVGLVQLDKSGLMASQRRRLAEVYHQELRGSRRIRLPAHADGETCTLYTIRVPDRDVLHFGRQMERRGVQVDRSYDFALPHLLECRRYATSAYPNAARATTEVVNLPFHPGLSEKAVRLIAACARNCAGKGA